MSKFDAVFKLFLTALLALFISKAWAQDSIVRGTVTDFEDNEGMPGVSISIKNKTTGTTTDLEGNYTLEGLSEDDILVFSFMGYAIEEEQVGSRSIIDVTMIPDVQSLSEVVVTAFGIERDKRSLGFASQSIDAAPFTEARENNVVNSLSGRVSGLQVNQAGTGPGGTSRVTIRGSASIAGNNAPLYVVDGVPMNNPQGGGGQFGGVDYGDGISNINPDDIESIDVLKGAAGTALYGSRGQNGVIMVTTKKGKAREGIGVEFNSNATFETPLVLPNFQNNFGRGSNGQFALTEAGNINNQIRTSWGPRTLGQEVLDWTGEVRPFDPQPNNISDFFQTGQSFTNSLAFTGGNDKTQARLSLTHLHSSNIMPNSDLERFNVNLNINSKLSEKLRVEAKINYIRQDAFNRPNLALSPDNVMNSFIQMPRTIRLNDLRDFRLPNGRPRVYTNAPGNDQWQNPFWATQLNTNEDTRDRIIGYAKLEYQFTDWLKGHIRSGTDFFNDFRQTRNATNTIYRTTPDGSFFNEVLARQEERNTDIVLTAFHSINDDWNISGNLGANFLQQRFRSTSTTALGLEIPDFFVMQNALDLQTMSAISQKDINSLFGTAQVDYKDWAFLEVTARNDWSSALPAESRSFFYPSIAGSWIMTDAIDAEWGFLNYAKFRASYAEVGNDTGPHQLDLLYFVNALSHGGQSFGQISRTRPPVNLRPERTSTYEVGTDFGLFNNKLTGDFTYYYAATTDQILQVPISNTSGFTSAFINAGQVSNQGFEFTLNATVIERGNFTWSTYANITRNRSRIDELAPNIDVYQLGSTYDQFGVRVQAEVGGEFGDIYADRPFLYDDAGNRVIGNNGLPLQDTEGGIQRIGNFQPDLLYGWGQDFRYKNWSAGVLLDGRVGGDIYSFSNAIAAANGNATYTQEGRQAWYAGAGGYVAEGVTANGEPNTRAVNPQTYWQHVGGQASSFAKEFLYDGSFLKLREINIGYNFPSSVTDRLNLQSLRLSFVGRNLFILHKNTPGFDPEATFTSGNDQGIEAFAFPALRSYGFNLNVSL
ncbi:MAG: SusC/RagA family TonB-linked outer membrane protein [Cyclobacteriaceae bacterium]|nr:SusC/RagA family TonB-linked outer membrane protein [Cyclobacteriaceae bacterium]MCH8516333.1 SusC/RagA family TonB-linked outer membrane protein [Cyclobacteriaceae bacterium]